jgi:RNase H-like domain found in reverse transcriptase
LALITAVTKWKHYVIGQEFIIKTDQISLKHLLDQKAHTSIQHRGLNKLLGLQYKIKYKRGVENKVADVLSRCEGHSGNLLQINAEISAFSELSPMGGRYQAKL